MRLLAAFTLSQYAVEARAEGETSEVLLLVYKSILARVYVSQPFWD